MSSLTGRQLVNPLFVCMVLLAMLVSLTSSQPTLDNAIVMNGPGQSPTPTPTLRPTPSRTPTRTSSATPSRTPTSTPSGVSAAEWSQFGANAQRISWLPQDISNWSFKCMATGLSLRNKAQIITGGGRLYVATTSDLVALNEQCGQVWSVSLAPSGSPAYDNGWLYTLGTNGTLYKLNSASGATATSFATGAAGVSAPLVTGTQVIFSAGNYVYALDKTTLAQVWRYDAGGPVATMPAYSESGVTVVVARDLYAHAISASGTRLWRVKPTVRNYGTMTPDTTTVALADASYPVIAELHGLVFVKYQLDWSETYRVMHQANNAWIRNLLTTNPEAQTLFALRMSDGGTAFIPNIGPGGAEESGAQGYIIDPSFPPVIRILPDGIEVAYSICRGRGNTLYDSRWDSGWCEMMLDGTTVPGLSAGDVRWITYMQPPNLAEASTYMITDEQPYMIGSGSMLLAAHWQAGQSLQITDRSNQYGAWSNKIKTAMLPTIVNIEYPPSYAPCTQNNSTHYCSGNLFYDETSQGWGGRLYSSGFWVYWGSANGSGGNSFTVSKNMVIYTYRGAVLVLSGTASGASPATTALNAPTPTRTPTPTAAPGTPTATPTLITVGTTRVMTHSVNAQQIGKYEKYEVTFSLSRSFPVDSFDPYYPFEDSQEGITVDAVVTSPSGQQFTVPAFFYVDYQRTGTTQEVIEPTGTAAWKVRYAPSEIGRYQYYITLRDKTGTSRYPASGTLTFDVVASQSPGFVRVSQRDSRYMEFDNGETFIPVASGRQWWQCCGKRSLDYEQAFDAFGANGINLTRIWTQNDGFGLTVEGHFDQYKYPDDFNPVDRGIDISTLPKGTQINQRGARDLDYIVESAEQNGVYLQLCSRGDPFWIWDASVVDEPWNPNPLAMSDPRHIAQWKRNFRYQVARWGYSTSVLAWETWNEHGHVLANSDEWNFYAAYSQYQRATDPYNHLLTTSQGSQTYSPAFWTSGFFDIANYHDYMMPGRYPADLVNDEAKFVYSFAWCLGTNGCSGLGLGDGSQWSGGPMPFVWGEFDAGTANWNEVNPTAQSGEGRLRMLHNSTWAGLFSPIATSPLDWYWNLEDAATTNACLTDRKITAQFFDGVDLAGQGSTYLMSTTDKPNDYVGDTISVSNPSVRVYAIRGSSMVLAWAQNREYVWSNPNTPAAVSASFTIPGVNGNYSVTMVDTHSGAETALGTVVANGSLALNVSGLARDVAFKATKQ
jgi:hypothetical protein